MIYTILTAVILVMLAILAFAALMTFVCVAIIVGVMVSDACSEVFNDGEHPKTVLKGCLADLKDCFSGFKSWLRWFKAGWGEKEPERYRG